MERKALFYAAVPSAAALFFFASAVLLGLAEWRPPAARIFIYYVLVSPALEEFIFRAGLQRFLTDRGFSLFAADAAASVVFSCAHLFFSAPLHAAAVFFPSLVFGFVYGRTGSLFSAIFVHAVFNMNVFISYQSDILGKIF